MRQCRGKRAAAVLFAVLVLVAVGALGCRCLRGEDRAERTSSPDRARALPSTRTEFFKNIVLRNGWEPVGVSPVEDEGDAVYRFVYYGERLEAVYDVSSGQRLVYGNALVIHPSLSQYGMGSLVVCKSGDSPDFAFNVPQAAPGFGRYELRFDADGRVVEYEVVVPEEEGPPGRAVLRPKYDARGVPVRLDVTEDTIGWGFRREDYGYDEKDQRVFCATHYADGTVRAQLWLGDGRQVTRRLANGAELVGPNLRLVTAFRLPDGRYEIESYHSVLDEKPVMSYADELPEEFRQYIDELPIPPEDSDKPTEPPEELEDQ